MDATTLSIHLYMLVPIEKDIARLRNHQKKLLKFRKYLTLMTSSTLPVSQ